LENQVELKLHKQIGLNNLLWTKSHVYQEFVGENCSPHECVVGTDPATRRYGWLLRSKTQLAVETLTVSLTPDEARNATHVRSSKSLFQSTVPLVTGYWDPKKKHDEAAVGMHSYH
jgi:hypothetical protein